MLTGVLAQAGTFVGPTVDWWGLSPLLVLAGGGILLMVVAALVPRGWPNGLYAFATATIAGAALVLSVFLWDDVQDAAPKGLVGRALNLDGFGLFLTVVICLSVILSAMLLDGYLRREEQDGVEVYALMLMSAVGGVVMVMANDLVVLFLGLETLSLALYVMAASHLRRIESQESGLKYFILGGFSSAFLLYGIALVYGATGTTNLGGISQFLTQNVLLSDHLLLAGFALLLVGLGFKVAAVPFQWWTPDVYQGAPTPVTAFMASAAKAAGFAALLRVFVAGFDAYAVDWRPAVYVLAVLTLLVGATMAVVQTDVKRMLAFSSISHAGFILLGVEAASERGTSAALFYLFAYAVMVVGTFGVVTVVSRQGDAATGLDAYRGLARSQPLLAAVFTVLLLSQAGVPFTVGFVAKFGVIGAAADAGSWALAVVAMLAAVIAAYLYLRIIVTMYLADPPTEPVPHLPVPVATVLALGVAALFTLVLGVVPSPLLDFARDAVPALALR